jgi:general secretion pathway protein M
MNEIKQWFLDQSPRDQMMLSVGAVVVAVYILFFLVLFPMQNDLSKTQKRNLASLQEQQTVRDLAGQVLAQQQGGQPAAGSQNLTSMLNDSTRQFGLRMENVQPTGNSARVRLGASEFNSVLAWLHEMEIKQGLRITDLTLTADKNPGTVLVNLQLTQGE